MKRRASISIFLSVLLVGTLNLRATNELTVNNRDNASTGGLSHIRQERRSLAFISLATALQVGQLVANKEDNGDDDEEDEPLLPPRGDSYTISLPQIRQFGLRSTRDRLYFLG